MGQVISNPLVNCFLIGSPKSGTTSLADTLSQHPDICLVEDKEPRFFSHDSIFEKGFDYYHNKFRTKANSKIFLDASTTYSEHFLERYKRSARRIFEYNPNAKIIY